MISDLRESFVKLVRFGIGTSKDVRISNAIEWERMKTLADGQGLSAVVLDGIDKANTNLTKCTNDLPVQIKLEWIGEVVWDYEQRYVQYEKAIGSLAGLYNQHGYKMMVLKGYACSLDWPRPEYRPCGDIDIWLFGLQKEADKVIKEKGIEIDNSHHHHTVFDWDGFSVENHYDFINVYHHKSHVALEKTLKELGADDSHFVELNGVKVYLPSPNLNALFLIKHAILHFCSTELTVRQILDWGFFVEKHGIEVDWKWLIDVLNEHGMMPFFNIINAICVEDLGFNSLLFPAISSNPLVKDKVMNEIFSYVYHEECSLHFFQRQINRFRRWKANEWKHKLCYKESMWSSFWSGVWGHLLKPSSI